MSRFHRWILLAALGLAGCAGSPATLDVRSEQSSNQFVTDFDRAFYSLSTDGQLDLILVSDSTSEASIDRPLTTSGKISVRQIVHMHVLWQQPRSLRIDNPSAANAMLDWHVLASPTDRLSYTGAGWARVSIDDDEAEVDVRNASVSISEVVGSVNDPLKRASISGTITARRSDATVKSYLDEISSLRVHDQTAQSGAPTRRTPSNP